MRTDQELLDEIENANDAEGPDPVASWSKATSARTYVLTIDARGRIRIPADLRAAKGWKDGTQLVLSPSAEGGLLVAAKQDEA